MKKLILASIFLIGAMQAVNAQQFKVITVVESIVPGGIGRSRIIDSKEEINYKSLTTEREEGNDGKAQRKIDRDDAKIESLEETKLLNFYSLMGINFQNIASNDAIITSKLNDMANQGYELAFVTSGVESDAGDKDGKGIFITRFIFKKK